MECCNAPGIMKVSPLRRQFFAHKATPADCNSKPETPEHLELKAVVYEAVGAADGWSAGIEVPGRHWRADVLATRGKARVAFEIQLSKQSAAETIQRQLKYQQSAVLPWWLVTSRNSAGAGFGSRLRTVLPGAELADWTSAAKDAVFDVLKRIESQVRIAAATAEYLRSHDIPYQLSSFCSIPVVFTLNLEKENPGKQQVIVIGELGPDALPNFKELQARANQNAWGSMVQFVTRTPQIGGFGSTAFFLKGDLRWAVHRKLDRLFSGRLLWCGPQHKLHIEAAFVWYPQKCGWCQKLFARAPFVITAHLHCWPDFPKKLAVFPPDAEKEKGAIAEIIKTFESRIGLRLGERWQPGEDPLRPAIQNCPHCGYTHSETLVSAEDALRLWPDSEIDWLYSFRDLQALRRRYGRAGGRWLKPVVPQARPLPPSHVWLQKLELSRRRREKARANQLS
jgi:hypothetical protein